MTVQIWYTQCTLHMPFQLITRCSIFFVVKVRQLSTIRTPMLILHFRFVQHQQHQHQQNQQYQHQQDQHQRQHHQNQHHQPLYYPSTQSGFFPSFHPC